MGSLHLADLVYKMENQPKDDSLTYSETQHFVTLCLFCKLGHIILCRGTSVREPPVDLWCSMSWFDILLLLLLLLIIIIIIFLLLSLLPIIIVFLLLLLLSNRWKFEPREAKEAKEPKEVKEEDKKEEDQAVQKTKEDQANKCIPYQLQRLFLQLQVRERLFFFLFFCLNCQITLLLSSSSSSSPPLLLSSSSSSSSSSFSVADRGQESSRNN